ncbi:MAG: phytanoyl-CoA dioxygenase family protein [Planctomycetes bacterium]|nr:phytanoyl-CoA dioxygenase family protein [Planctomycetota bacterium]
MELHDAPRVTDETRAAYEELGFVSLGVRFDTEAIETLREDLWTFARENERGDNGLLFNNLWRRLPHFAELIQSPALVRAVSDLIGEPEITLFQDNLVWKFPGSGQIDWHQDYSYQPLTATPGVSLWVSLDEADAESGCLHYIPGTHLLGERQPADFVVGSDQPPIPGLPPLDWQARAAQVVAAVARPGEVLAHHPLVWHMSPMNRTTRHRRALSINWVTPDARWNPSHSPHPFNHYLSPSEGSHLQGELFPRFRQG